MKYFSIKKAAMLVAASTLALGASSAFADVKVRDNPTGVAFSLSGPEGNVQYACYNLGILSEKVSGLSVGTGLHAKLVDRNGYSTSWIDPSNGYFNLQTAAKWGNRAVMVCVAPYVEDRHWLPYVPGELRNQAR